MKKLTLLCAAFAAAMSMNAQETTPLTIDMWHQWTGMNEETKVWGPDCKPLEEPTKALVSNLGKTDNFVLGNPACDGDCYADLSAFGGIEGKGTSSNNMVRFYFNRKDLQGSGVECAVEIAEDGTFKLDFSQIPGKPEFYHLNFVKFHYGQEGNIEYINLLPKSEEPEVPVDPLAINGDWFHKWSGYDAAATIVEDFVAVDDNIGKELTGGSTLLGTGSVWGDIYADLTKYEGIEAEGTPGLALRLLFNRPTQDSGITECNPVFDEDGKFTFMFTEVKDGDAAASFIHLNAVKTYGMGEAKYQITKFNVIEKTVTPDDPTAVSTIESVESSVLYNVFGQPVDENYRGIVIKNGKKYINK